MEPRVPTRREIIGRKVRQLRQARGWTQAELAPRLGMSQARLSELERGAGSFTAEQLLDMLRLFNVDVGAFAQSGKDHLGDLQNALVRFGAGHLQEDPQAEVTGRFASVGDAVVAVLIDPRSERLVTALAPVLVWSVDGIQLPAVQHELAQAGVPNRLGWIAENTLEALGDVPSDRPDLEWGRRTRRAETVLRSFLAHLPLMAADSGSREMPDPLDQGIRSTDTLSQVWEEASPISRRWKIASGLQVEDFRRALRGALESRP